MFVSYKVFGTHVVYCYILHSKTSISWRTDVILFVRPYRTQCHVNIRRGRVAGDHQPVLISIDEQKGRCLMRFHKRLLGIFGTKPRKQKTIKTIDSKRRSCRECFNTDVAH